METEGVPGTCPHSNNKCKASWGLQFQKIFVDLCVEQIYLGNKPKTHFNKDGWRNIIEAFEGKTGCRYDKKQFKNHWDVMKKQWKIWSKLTTDARLKWDSHQRKFGATPEEWDSYLMEHPEAAPYRYKELDFADQLDIIFEGIDFRGAPECPPRRKRQRETFAVPITVVREDHQVAKVARHPTTPHNPRDMGAAVMHDNRRVETGNLYDVESRSAVTVQSARGGVTTYSIGECIDCLDGMAEMDQGGELYLFALDLFLKKEYREIFLQLKTPTVKVAWLKHQQTVRSNPEQL